MDQPVRIGMLKPQVEDAAQVNAITCPHWVFFSVGTQNVSSLICFCIYIDMLC